MLSVDEITALATAAPGMAFVADIGGRVGAAVLLQPAGGGAPGAPRAVQLAMAAVHPGLEQAPEVFCALG